MNKLTEKQLLELVEWLTNNKADENKELGAIYEAVHSHREDACCHNVHEEWREQAVKTYEELKRLGEI